MDGWKNSKIISFGECVNLIRQRLAMLIAICLLAGIGTFGLTKFFVKPVYEAGAKMIVNSNKENSMSITNDQITSATKLSDTYAVIIKSRAVLLPVIEALDLNETYESLSKHVSVSPLDNTQIIQISVQNTNRDTAIKTVNEIIKIAPAVIIEAVEAGSVKTIEDTYSSENPVSPNATLYAVVAVFLAAIISLTVIIVRYSFDNTLKSEENIRQVLDMPVLGVIPNDEKARGDIKQARNREPSFAYQEAYKMLRTNMNFAVKENSIVAVTSSGEKEGKTTVSINLAKSIAETGKKVVLLDCDMRKPMIHRRVKLPHSNSDGLSMVLSGQTSLASCIQYSEASGIFCITAGPVPPNPAELLASDIMQDLLEMLLSKFDYVICDTPPIGIVADAAAIASKAAGAVLVVEQGKTPTDAVCDSIRKLSQINVKIFGVVLNKYDYSKDIGKNKRDSRDYGYEYAMKSGNRRTHRQ